MSQGIRVLRADRSQIRWDMVSLDSQLPPDHRARMVWSFVQGLDLAPFHALIKARDNQPGRPATDPAVVLALRLYATLDGVGAARAIERLCEHHAAYRWLAGTVPVNHDILSAFRRDSGARLDTLLTGSLTALIDEGVLSLEEMAIDGTKVQARANASARRGRCGRHRNRLRGSSGHSSAWWNASRRRSSGPNGMPRPRRRSARRRCQCRIPRCGRCGWRTGRRIRRGTCRWRRRRGSSGD